MTFPVGQCGVCERGRRSLRASDRNNRHVVVALTSIRIKGRAVCLTAGQGESLVLD